MYVCVCRAVTEREIREAVDAGARTLGDLQSGLGVATSCGQCACLAETLIEDHVQFREEERRDRRLGDPVQVRAMA